MSVSPGSTTFDHIGAAVARLPVAIAVTAPDGTIGYANERFQRLFADEGRIAVGRDIAELRRDATARSRLDMRSLLLAGETWQAEAVLETPRRTSVLLETAYPMQDNGGRVIRIVHFFHELSAFARVDTLGRLAFYDAITGLPGRSLFEEALMNAIAVARRRAKPLAVIYTDVDDFERVNRTLDRDAGDNLLRLMAQRMRHTLRASDSIARIRSDELAVLLPEVGGAADAFGTAEKLRRACSGWYAADGEDHAVSLSVGIAVLAAGDATAALLARAEQAMYRDKAARRERHRMHARFVGVRYQLKR